LGTLERILVDLDDEQVKERLAEVLFEGDVSQVIVSTNNNPISATRVGSETRAVQLIDRTDGRSYDTTAVAQPGE
jgi:hypothetical protein